MDQIEILDKLGMIEKPKTDWDSLLKTLAKNPGLKAQALYKKISARYNLDTSLIERTIMSDDTTVVEAPKPEETTPPVSE